MDPRYILAAMGIGSAVFLYAGRHSEAHKAVPHQAAHSPERPWLSHEAAAQIIEDGGTLGPLFAGITLGGMAPTLEERARISGFARANHVTIAFDTADGDLTGIRFSVEYAGCCGYEAADLLARRLRRPIGGSGACMGGPEILLDDWTITNGDGTTARAHVDVNRIDVQWRPTLTLPEMLDTADAMLGRSTAAVHKAHQADWVKRGDHYNVLVPYAFGGGSQPIAVKWDHGIQLLADAGNIVEVSFELPYSQPEDLTAHWGPAHKSGNTLTWSRPDRTIVADLDNGQKITLRQRL